MTCRIVLALAISVAVISTAVAPADGASRSGKSPRTARYALVDLGAPDGSFSTAINNRGQVIGGWTTIQQDEWGDIEVHRAFLWQDGLLADLGTLGGPDTVAQALNNRGQIIGTSTLAGCELTFFEVCSRAFLWEHGVMTDLGTLGGWASVATAINERGQIVGMTTTAECDFLFMDMCERAFLWHDGSMMDLGTLGGALVDDIAKARAINNRGQVVGSSAARPREDGDTRSHAFLWHDGVMIDLGTLGGDFSEARAINNRGRVVGWSTSEEAPRHEHLAHAVLWHRGILTDLDPLAPGSRATAINDRGQIIGQREGRAFIWDNGVMTDLGDLGGTFWPTATMALALNNKGQVVGWSTTPSGDFRAFLWQDGVLTELESPGEEGWTFATAINDRGDIVGYTMPAWDYEARRAVLWTPHRRARPIGPWIESAVEPAAVRAQPGHRR